MKSVSLLKRLWGEPSNKASRRKSDGKHSVEKLENRIVLYAASGNAWPNPKLITISFMPDGTSLGTTTSNLFSKFNTKFGTAATWQNQILKAAQYWAQQSNINFAVVTDSGAAMGSGSNQQGDSTMGDIRIGGYSFGNTTIAQAYLPPPVNNYSIAGDIQFNTGLTFNVGSTYDLFSVAVHEFGHALGLNHSTTSAAVMYGTYGAKTALNADDLSGIRNIYSANVARAKDVYDAVAANETTAAAKDLTSLINSTTKALVVNNLDLSTNTDIDVYKVVVPTGAATTIKATVQTTGFSLMKPKVEILNSTGTVKATASGTTYGGKITATFSGITAGQVYFVRVTSPDTIAAFKTGLYGLSVNMGTGTDPAFTSNSVVRANGSPLTSGGGQALMLLPESITNQTTADTQVTSERSIASSTGGNYVVTWSSLNSDGNGWGVYGRLYSKDGAPLTNEFRVNTTTTGDQVDPSVGMDIFGNFVVTWTSRTQDGGTAGIYGQRYDSNGLALGTEFLINTTSAGDQTASSVAMDGLNGFFVTWTSAGQDGAGAGIYARRYDMTGLPRTGEVRVNTTTAGDQTDSAVVVNRVTGDAVVTWTSSAQDGSGLGVYAQRFDANATLVGSEFKINTYTTGDQSDPALAINRLTGDFIVTWTSVGQDGSGAGIFAQRFSKLGVAQGTEFRVNTTTAGDQTDSSVALDAHGHAIVTWAGTTTTNGVQIYGQQLTLGGAKKEGEIVINNTAAGDQKLPSVTSDYLGRLTVIWSGAGSADSTGIYMARYRTDLDPLTTEDHHHNDGDDDTDHVPVSNSNLAASVTTQSPTNQHGHLVIANNAVLLAIIQDLQRRARREEPSTTQSSETTDRAFARSDFQAELMDVINDLRGSLKNQAALAVR
jgi:hypothetical protein